MLGWCASQQGRLKRHWLLGQTGNHEGTKMVGVKARGAVTVGALAAVRALEARFRLVRRVVEHDCLDLRAGGCLELALGNDQEGVGERHRSEEAGTLWTGEPGLGSAVPGRHRGPGCPAASPATDRHALLEY